MNLSEVTLVKDISLKHQIFNCMVNNLTNRMGYSTVISTVSNVYPIFLKCQIFNCMVNSSTNRMDNSTVMSMVLRSAGNSMVLWLNYNLIMHPSSVVNVKCIPWEIMFLWEPLPSTACKGEYISFHYICSSQYFCFSCPCATHPHFTLFYVSCTFSCFQEQFQISIKNCYEITHSSPNFQMEFLFPRKDVRYWPKVTITITIYRHSEWWSFPLYTFSFYNIIRIWVELCCLHQRAQLLSWYICYWTKWPVSRSCFFNT